MWLPLVLLTACDVHEWPDVPDGVPVTLKLRFETDMNRWNYEHDGSDVIEIGEADTYDNSRGYGLMRYVIRAYPADTKTRRDEVQPVREFFFSKDVTEGYDHEVSITLPPGRYTLAVWSDLVEYSGDSPFYDISDFSGIKIAGEYEGCNDYRDAFRGYADITITDDVTERLPETREVIMERPLAKFEFVANDVADFVNQENSRYNSESGSAAEKEGANAPDGGDNVAPVKINVENYRVVFQYFGYMPSSFGMWADKPVDSSTDVYFESTITKINEEEASMGFDYVMVNGSQTSVTLRLGIYDKEGKLLSVTDPITVPLLRNRHSVVRGRFLTTDAGGGLGIDPSYDGDFNLFF